MKQLPELLAPAGTPAAALAAYDAGADAVYAGLAKFNARERGENFTPETMAGMIRHAHKLNKKFYVTLNTLVKETELPELAEYLAMLDEMSPDALIVQDLGVLRLAREFFPNLTLHASTQMGFHNSAGIELAQSLGVKRVILERQLSLEEVTEISKKSPLELEVFVHGSLCCSLSGACLLSSYLGGYSGNRGKCKQPCRRRYYTNHGNGFFFSPQDLCTIDMLGELKKLKLASLKIEGRLRQPDYVSSVVGAYRMLLDAPEAEFPKLLGEARNLLSKSCGRKWSAGFYQLEAAKTLILHDSFGATGVLCGQVDELRDNGFSLTVKKRLFLGDRVRVQPMSGDEGPAMTITKMFVNNQLAKKALPGDRVTILCDKIMPERGLLFKIGESFGDYTARVNALPKSKIKLDLEVNIADGGISVALKNGLLDLWRKPIELAVAKSRSLSMADVAAEFAAADSDVFELGSVTGKVPADAFLPASVLKALRREYFDYLKANLKPEGVFRSSLEKVEKFRKMYEKLKVDYVLSELLTETVALRPNGAEPANRKAIRANLVYECNKLTDEAILPEFCAENRLESVHKAIKAAYVMGVRRFRVTSLYGLSLLKSYQDVTVSVSAPLPVCNSLAVLELLKFNVGKVMAHLELEKSAILALQAKSPLPLELYRYGRPVLLVSRAELPVDGEIKDARGNVFVVRYDGKSKLSRVYASSIISVPRLPGMYDYYDLINAHWGSEDTGTFNFDGALL